MVTLPENSPRQASALLAMNEVSAHFGLVLTAADAEMLLQKREEALQQSGRVELGGGILPKLVHAFCDSPYIPPSAWADTLAQLQEIFYTLKTDSLEKLDDDTLLHAMKTAFDGVCAGSAEYMADLLSRGLCRPLRFGVAQDLPFPL